MTDSITVALEKVHSGVGQGSVLEQIDKRYRKQQRLTLVWLKSSDRICSFKGILNSYENGKQVFVFNSFKPVRPGTHPLLEKNACFT